MDTRRLQPAVAGLLALTLAIAACSSAGTGATPGTGGPGGGGSTDPGAGGGSGSVPGDPGTGVLPSDPGGGVVPDPQGTLVFPRPGVIDPRPVFVSGLSSTIADGHLVVRLEWTSGVEPCYTLSAVHVGRDGDTFTLQALEGTTDKDIACIDMAMYKATLVDLGVLAAGNYTVKADPGDAAPLVVTIP